MAQQPSRQHWNADLYTRTAGFVAEMGEPVLALLAPMPGERILDLGCGDGRLTERLSSSGADVVGVDAGPDMVEAARRRGIDVRLMPAEELTFDAEFDAVFSNAALHWVLRPEKAVAGIARALKPGGRFVAEFGGAGNIALLCDALRAVLAARGHDFQALSPWYFPTPEEYAAVLGAAGFTVNVIGLHPRPVQLPGDIGDWLAMFCSGMFGVFSESERLAVVDEIRSMLRPQLCDAQGVWTIDYVRLRLAARLAEDR